MNTSFKMSQILCLGLYSPSFQIIIRDLYEEKIQLLNVCLSGFFMARRRNMAISASRCYSTVMLLKSMTLNKNTFVNRQISEKKYFILPDIES